ncbi:MAG: phosphonate ABC transporter ATP-binding protein [Chloroflexi bacterium]|nr:phosphonate ABC transporter ATP-binding protein [Chloroflexota bacterium]MBV9897890.1 phosphonate ABC transporter ATP-binding protein [Chloroflexota bacterium]
MSKAYAGKRSALQNVALTVAAGELVVVLGANGSGKSTLLRCIVRLTEPTSGSIRILGSDFARLPARQLREARRRVAMIFQTANLVRRRSALENVATGALGRHRDLATALGRLPRAELLRAGALLERVGLLHLAQRRADTLSGGEAQRVAIARGLAQQPRLLLADEPVASLDPEAAQDVLVLLSRLAVDDGLGVLCVLHQPELALWHAHRIAGLRHGSVLFDAPPAEVTSSMLSMLYRGDTD